MFSTSFFQSSQEILVLEYFLSLIEINISDRLQNYFFMLNWKSINLIQDAH